MPTVPRTVEAVAVHVIACRPARPSIYLAAPTAPTVSGAPSACPPARASGQPVCF
jgi:hypothetical protein